ncbi:MAG: TetR family transcriptional regulator [Gammaproteobacteria bacterium]|nr:TetR family transcriptional regulator [Gammaproteobacteria bacterium]
MVRRTKEEALETRNRILDTAEKVFHSKGVSRTSLADIAIAAGVTRGAIYWHFKNKADLFEAMMKRMKLPMEEMVERAGSEALADPLDYVRQCSLAVLERLTTDPQCRCVTEISRYKVEYADDMESLRERHIECRTEALTLIERGLRNAAKKGMLAPNVDPHLAAIGLHALVDGLIHNWILDPSYIKLAKAAAPLIDGYLRGLRAVTVARTATTKKRA